VVLWHLAAVGWAESADWPFLAAPLERQLTRAAQRDVRFSDSFPAHVTKHAAKPAAKHAATAVSAEKKHPSVLDSIFGWREIARDRTHGGSTGMEPSAAHLQRAQSGD
jgi:hypothetical protein